MTSIEPSEEPRGILRRVARGVFFIIILLLTAGAAYSGFFIWKARNVSKKISITNPRSSSLIQDVQTLVGPLIAKERKKLRGEAEGRINILLLGAAGKDKPGKNLTDTVMVASVDTKEWKVALLSLPRDLYVNIPETRSYTKINSLYQIGLKENVGAGLVKKAVEEVLAIPIHYHLVMDFDGFKKVIDDVGGINVNVERDIYDPRYPGPNYSYTTFELKKGFQKLDGDTALKYVRERHDDPEGDFGRAKRQQQVIQATKNKVFSLGTFLNVFTLNELLNTLGDHVTTDIPLDEFESFIELSKKVDSEHVTNVVVDAWKKDSLLKVSHVFYGDIRAFVLVPKTGNWSEIQETAATIFDRRALEERKEKIASEVSRIAVLNGSTDPSLDDKVISLLRERSPFSEITILPTEKNKIQENTVILDYTDTQKPYSLDELLKKLSAKLDNQRDYPNVDGDKKFDFVVILGNNLGEQLEMEEDNVTEEEYRESEDNQEAELMNIK